MPRSRPQLRALTGTRYFAALAVLLFHYGRILHLPWIVFSLGRQTVSLFFILSGFVLTYAYHRSFMERTISWKAFANRRLARIVPLHLAAFALATVIYWNTEPRSIALKSWLANLFCVQVYWPSATLALHWNAPSWSISCELFFYAAFPLLLLLIGRRSNAPRRLIATAIVVYAFEVMAYLWSARHIVNTISRTGAILGFTDASRAMTNILPLTPFIRIGEFIIGMCLGLLVIGGGPKQLRTSFATRNVAVALVVAATVFLQKAPLEKLGETAVRSADYLLYVPPSALLILVLASGRTFLSPLLEHPVTVLLGESSYSLYLLHYPLGALFLGDHSPARYAVAFVAANVLAVISFLLIERPLMRVFAARPPAQGLSGSLNRITVSAPKRL